MAAEPGQLAVLQQAFVAAVLARDPGVERYLGAAAATGLGIYRTNVRTNFAAALAAAFPALHALLGSDRFESLAWACQRARPSTRGDLFFAGESLVAFLAEDGGDAPGGALTELARLEWAIQQVLVAADPPSRLDLEALAGVPADQHAGLRFTLLPALRVVVVAAGTAARWEHYRAATAQAAGDVPQAAGAGEETLLVWRSAEGLRVRVSEPGEAALLGSLRDGMPLGAACASVLAGVPGVDPAGLIVRAAQAGLLTGFVPPG